MPLLVRAACLTNFSAVARAGGIDPVSMLDWAGLPPSVEADPDRLIPVDSVARLLNRSADLSGNEAFGLCMAESRRLSNLGAVGLLIRDQATLRDSLAVLIRYQALLNGSLVLMLEEHRDMVIVREQVRSSKPELPTRQRIELALGVMLQLMRQFLGADWQPRRLCFEHQAPKNLSVHRRVLGRRLEFDADFNGIVCARSDLDARNPVADPEMARYAMRLLTSASDTRPNAFVEAVRRAILWLLPSGHCSVRQVAEYFGVSSRTVQRLLSLEGATFSSLVNDLRRELAVRYVVGSNRPLTEIALLLGFSAPSTFSRWYQTEFTCSARDMRTGRNTPNELLKFSA